METQFAYLQKLAAEYYTYSSDSNKLFAAINSLPKETLQAVFKEYGDQSRPYRPVNLLRAEVARLASSGAQVDNQLLEEIKKRIRERDTSYFSAYGENYLTKFRNYKEVKGDVFGSWLNPWSILHTFFYRDQIKETVSRYLKQIAQQLLQDLELKDHTYHIVDFQGSANFGAKRCWIALYPKDKASHKKAYQFFLNLTKSPEAGCVSGSEINDKDAERLKAVTSYQESLPMFEEVKDYIQQKNNTLTNHLDNPTTRTYYKFSPGAKGVKWQEFYEQGIMAIGFVELNVGDLSDYDSIENLNLKAGQEGENQSNQTWNLWLFRNAKEGDVVFATLGVSACLGIGIVEGPYYYDAAGGDFPHRRKVKWITDKLYHIDEYRLKEKGNLIRKDTFSPTKKWGILLQEYLRVFPELEETFRQHQILVDFPHGKPPGSSFEEDRDDYVEKPSSKQNYWWLNANPAIWSIKSMKEGESQTYTARNERGNKRRVYKYFQEVKPGDLVIGYESSPVKNIVGLLKITKSLYSDRDQLERIEFTLTEKLDIPVSWSELVNFPELQQCEVVINNQGSLFKLTEEEFEVIQAIIDEKNLALKQQGEGD